LTSAGERYEAERNRDNSRPHGGEHAETEVCHSADIHRVMRILGWTDRRVVRDDAQRDEERGDQHAGAVADARRISTNGERTHLIEASLRSVGNSTDAKIMADDSRQLQGATQLAVMRAVWRTSGGTVDEVRNAMPDDLKSSYTTIQTLLNRLAERGLLVRDPGRTARGPTGKITYRPAISEEQYLTESIERALDGASPEARTIVISNLIGRLGEPAPPKRKKRKRDTK
jgi:predicted transcriptional regulator